MTEPIVIALITSGFGAVAALGGSIAAAITARMSKRVREVHDSTVNSHGPDLRKDIDKALMGIGEVKTLVTQSLVAGTQTRAALDAHIQHHHPPKE